MRGQEGGTRFIYCIQAVRMVAFAQERLNNGAESERAAGFMLVAMSMTKDGSSRSTFRAILGATKLASLLCPLALPAQ